VRQIGREVRPSSRFSPCRRHTSNKRLIDFIISGILLHSCRWRIVQFAQIRLVSASANHRREGFALAEAYATARKDAAVNTTTNLRN
jgi:hypothetical protein